MVVFNIYFLLLSESPLEAILKSVALAFIYQMDITLSPKLGQDQTAEVKSDFAYNYITKPLQPGAITVTKSGFPGLVYSNKSKVTYVSQRFMRKWGADST